MHDTPLSDRAKGRWPGILAALGVPAKLLNTKKHQACPFCGGKDRFRFTDHEGNGRFYCNQCGSIGGVDFVMKFRGCDFATAAKEIETVMADVRPNAPKPTNDAEARASMKRLWETGSLIARGDFVDRYFAARGIRQEAYPSSFRRVESAKHEDEDGRPSWHPALVAKITGPDGNPSNLHRTYLTLDGRKADVEPTRKMMRGGVAKGSAIRLSESGPVLGIAEGIETAFAAMELFRVPVWSAINTTMMKSWQPPEGTDQVIVFGDNDPKFGGQAAAAELAHRLACAGVVVDLRIPDLAGQDWNDVLLLKRRCAA